MNTDINKIKVGDLVAEVMFSKVKKVNCAKGEISVKNVDYGQEYRLCGRELVETVWSADAFNEEKKVTLTNMAEILVVAFNKPFTVEYLKKDGSDRTLRGRLVSSEHLMGRIMCEDLDVEIGSRIRQIDLRTLKSLILGGVKYTIKK